MKQIPRKLVGALYKTPTIILTIRNAYYLHTGRKISSEQKELETNPHFRGFRDAFANDPREQQIQKSFGRNEYNRGYDLGRLAKVMYENYPIKKKEKLARTRRSSNCKFKEDSTKKHSIFIKESSDCKFKEDSTKKHSIFIKESYKENHRCSK